VRFANNTELPTLADKLDHFIRTKLVPNAGKTKAKSVEDEKQFKAAEKVLDEYLGSLINVFRYFGRTTTQTALQVDFTMSVQDLINMFRKARILDTDRLSLREFIDVIERYHTPGSDKNLSERLCEDNFKKYLRVNHDLLAINKEVAARKQWVNECAVLEKDGKTPEEIKELMADKVEPRDISDDERKEREHSETAELHAKWEQETISQHLMFIKGAEVIF